MPASKKVQWRTDGDGRYVNPAARESSVPVPPPPALPTVVVGRGPGLQQRTIDKRNEGPDATQARLANSPYYESELMAIHHGAGSGKVDADGAPAMRVQMVHYLESGLQEALEALQDKAQEAAVEAALAPLRTSPKRSHRRAYVILKMRQAGMTEAAIAAIAGTGGKRISQPRVCQIIQFGLRVVAAAGRDDSTSSSAIP